MNVSQPPTQSLFGVIVLSEAKSSMKEIFLRKPEEQTLAILIGFHIFFSSHNQNNGP